MGYAFGLVGGLLFVAAGIVAIATGTADLILGRALGAIDSWTQAAVLFVVGGLGLLFGYMARHQWSARPVVGGTMLAVTGVIGWGAMLLGPSLLGLLGAILVFLAGVLYLVEPVGHGIARAATA